MAKIKFLEIIEEARERAKEKVILEKEIMKLEYDIEHFDSDEERSEAIKKMNDLKTELEEKYKSIIIKK